MRGPLQMETMMQGDEHQGDRWFKEAMQQTKMTETIQAMKAETRAQGTPVPVKNSIGPTVTEFDAATRRQVKLALHPSRSGAVMIFVLGIWAFVRALLVSSAAVSLENVALRHQLAILQRSVRRPRFRRRDRIFWLWLARLWAGGPASSLFSPRLFSLGIAKVSSSTGAGSPGAAQRVARRSILRSAP